MSLWKRTQGITRRLSCAGFMLWGLGLLPAIAADVELPVWVKMQNGDRLSAHLVGGDESGCRLKFPWQTKPLAVDYSSLAYVYRVPRVDEEKPKGLTQVRFMNGDQISGEAFKLEAGSASLTLAGSKTVSFPVEHIRSVWFASLPQRPIFHGPHLGQDWSFNGRRPDAVRFLDAGRFGIPAGQNLTAISPRMELPSRFLIEVDMEGDLDQYTVSFSSTPQSGILSRKGVSLELSQGIVNASWMMRSGNRSIVRTKKDLVYNQEGTSLLLRLVVDTTQQMIAIYLNDDFYFSMDLEGKVDAQDGFLGNFILGVESQEAKEPFVFRGFRVLTWDGKAPEEPSPGDAGGFRLWSTNGRLLSGLPTAIEDQTILWTEKPGAEPVRLNLSEHYVMERVNDAGTEEPQKPATSLFRLYTGRPGDRLTGSALNFNDQGDYVLSTKIFGTVILSPQDVDLVVFPTVVSEGEVRK